MHCLAVCERLQLELNDSLQPCAELKPLVRGKIIFRLDGACYYFVVGTAATTIRRHIHMWHPHVLLFELPPILQVHLSRAKTKAITLSHVFSTT